MKRILFIIILFFSITACFGQYTLKKAERLYDEMAYIDAAEAYEAYLKAGHKPKRQTMLHIADTYYYTNSYRDAERWYEKYDVSKLDAVRFNRYIQVMRATERYEKADAQMRSHLAKDAEALQRFDRSKKYLDSINVVISPYTVTNLKSNSKQADFGTAFYKDSIVYSSAKDMANLGGKVYVRNKQPYLDLYIAGRDAENGAFLGETKFMPKAKTRYHNAGIVFTPDWQTVYYSTNTVKKHDRLKSDNKGTNNIRIVKGTVTEGGIINTSELPFNSIGYSVGHPALSADGKWLYFTSDMPGGYGETDLYRVTVDDEGKYGKPENLGPEINTVGKEMFPFINGNTLYFASDGHYGMGGLDIFECRILPDTGFNEPKNLGAPVNSNLDDFAYIISTDNSYGYFSSNRKKGKGDDDIYYFTKKKEDCHHTITGVVTDANSKQPIAEATVTVKDESGNIIAQAVTDSKGNYKTGNISCSYYIVMEAAKPEHTTDSKNITTPDGPSSVVKVDFELSQFDDLVEKKGDSEKIKINPIYFDFDKYNITPQAATELDKVVYVLNNFPDVTIKIASHTDSRGNDDYNNVLSGNRAKATRDYIVQQGIAPNRIISVTGYGEAQLINKCSNGVVCTEEEHLRNRRSEFIIVTK